MIDRIVTILATTLMLVMVAEPAMADAISLPEPSTMSIFGLGAGGVFLAKKFFGRR